MILVVVGLFGLMLSGCAVDPNSAPTGVTLSVNQSGQPKQVAADVQLLVLLTILSIAPAILILATSFENRTYEELSRQWNVPLGTLLSRKHRALSKMNKILSNN